MIRQIWRCLKLQTDNVEHDSAGLFGLKLQTDNVEHDSADLVRPEIGGA